MKLPRARPSLLCPLRGRRERAQARVGKDKAALADTALPSCLYTGRGAHFAAEPMAITIVPPKGAKGASYASEGKDKAALADTALPSCL